MIFHSRKNIYCQMDRETENTCAYDRTARPLSFWHTHHTRDGTVASQQQRTFRQDWVREVSNTCTGCQLPYSQTTRSLTNPSHQGLHYCVATSPQHTNGEEECILPDGQRSWKHVCRLPYSQTTQFLTDRSHQGLHWYIAAIYVSTGQKRY